MKSEKRRGAMLIVGVALLWAATVVLSLFAIRQLRKIEGELALIDIEATRLAQVVAQVDILHLESAIMLRNFMGVLSGEAAEPLLRLRERPRHLNDFLSQQASQIEILNGLIGEMSSLRRAEHSRAFDEVRDLVVLLSKTHSAYMLFVEERVTGRGQGAGVSAQVLEELARREAELDELVDRVSAGVRALVQQSLASSAAYKHTSFVEMAVVAGLVVIFGLVLVIMIARMQRRLIESENLALVGKMAVTLRHEINNPLAAIVGNAYLLRNKGDLTEEQRRQTAAAIEESAQRISTVVKRLSELKEVAITDHLGGVEMLDLSKEK